MRTRRRRKTARVEARLPMPEVLSDGSWSVQNGTPMVDLPGRVISVPTADTPAAAFLRAHEMAHIKITPHKHAHELSAENGISMEAMQAVEDFRVHTFLKRCAIHSPAILSVADMLPGIKAIRSQKMLMSMYLSMYPCPKQLRLFKQALSAAGKTDDELDQMHSLATALSQAFHMQEETLQSRMDALASPDGFSALTVPIAKLFDELFDDDADELIPVSRYAWAGHDYIPWGELEPVARATLSAPKRSKRGHQKLWREDGVIPVATYRLTIDNKIFTRKRKLVGGTVLVDASGSMSFTDDDLAELISVAPGARVAVYAGKRTSGRLVIVADKGRMATSDAIAKAMRNADGEIMYGNVVDGPALRWLARQPGPRTWVSDGIVTGENDSMAHNLRTEAVQLLKQHDIERVENWRELLDSFR
jgi:hypothetical protein